ncbi:MAG: hypothetical protein R3C28_32365 [Pirellulaceae bacterium]
MHSVCSSEAGKVIFGWKPGSATLAVQSNGLGRGRCIRMLLDEFQKLSHRPKVLVLGDLMLDRYTSG